MRIFLLLLVYLLLTSQDSLANDSINISLIRVINTNKNQVFCYPNNIAYKPVMRFRGGSGFVLVKSRLKNIKNKLRNYDSEDLIKRYQRLSTKLKREKIICGQLANFIDGDLDNVDDAFDNCLGISNTSQIDLDLNDIGDACEDPITCRTEICSCRKKTIPSLPADLQEYITTNISTITNQYNISEVQDSWYNIYSYFNPLSNNSALNLQAWWNRSSIKRNFDFSGTYNDTPDTDLNNRAGTLVSPRHIIFAKHYQHALGTKVIFIAANGTRVERTIIAKESLPDSYDITVGYLNADVPNYIAIYKTLPSNYLNYLSLDHLPILMMNRFEKIYIRQLYTPVPNYPSYLLHGCFDFDIFCQHELTGGDSGHPAFMAFGDELVLLFVHSTTASGEFIAHVSDLVNAAMKNLDLSNHNTGYHSLTTIDLVKQGELSCRCDC